MANSVTTTIDVAPRGDVVFICNGDDGSTWRLRASSAIISHASPVFEAMLRPHFKEGSTLATTSYVEIALPEDHPSAMDILLKIIHMQNHLLSELSISELEHLAVVTDKYQCAAAIAPVAHYWLSEFREVADLTELRSLLQCAYLFSMNDHFREIAHELVMDSEEPIRGEPGVLTDVYTALEDQRIETIMSLSSFIQQDVLDVSRLRMTTPHACTHDCKYAEFYALAAIRKLGEAHLWPVPSPGEGCIRDAISSMETVKCTESLTEAEKKICSGKSCIGLQYFSSKRTKRYHKKGRQVADGIRKMCIRCVREGLAFKRQDCPHKSIKRPFDLV